MRYIPYTTKVKHKFYKGLGYVEMLVLIATLILVAGILTKYTKQRLVVSILIFLVTCISLIRIDDKSLYLYAVDAMRFMVSKKKVKEEIVGSTRKYIELSGLNFVSSTGERRLEVIEIFKRGIGTIKNCRISKVLDLKKYTQQIEEYKTNIENLKESYKEGLLKQDEYEVRIAIAEGIIQKLYSREQEEYLCYRYFISFESDPAEAIEIFESMGMQCKEVSEREYLQIAFPQNNEKVRYKTNNYDFCGCTGCWQTLSQFKKVVDMGYGIDLFNTQANVYVDIREADRAVSIRKLDKAIFEMQSRKRRKKSDDIDAEDLQSALEETLISIKNGDKIYEVVATFQCFDKSGENKNKKANKKELGAEGFKVKDEIFLQKQIFDLISRNKFMQKKCITMDATTLSYMFPFQKYEVEDKDGIYVNSEEPNFVNFFKRDTRHLNSNLVVLGTPGSGKSYCAKDLLINLSVKDSKIMILDIEGEYKKLCEYLHGEVKTIKHTIPFDPFEINDLDVEDFKFLMHMEFLKTLYQQLFQNLKPEELEELINVTRRTYEEVDKVTFIQLLERIETKSIYNKIEPIIRRISDSCGTVVDANRRCVCFDFSRVFEEKDRGLFNAYLMLTIKEIEKTIFENIKYNKIHKTNRKVIVLIDESHILLDECRKDALDFIYLLSKRIRKYDGMMILATQSLRDFQSEGKYEKKTMSPLSAAQYAMIFKIPQGEWKDVENTFITAKGDGLCDISTLKRGEMIFVEDRNEFSLIQLEKSDKEGMFKL